MNRLHGMLALLFVVTAPGCAGGEVSTDDQTGAEGALSSGRYLALGDSVSFGYQPQIDPSSAKNFPAYPEGVAAKRREPVANASCYGESSGSLLSVALPDHGCRSWRAAHPMKVQYSSAAESQLQFALDYLGHNPTTDLITLQVGANDVLILQDSCTAAVQQSACFAAGYAGCLASANPPACLAQLGANCVAQCVGAALPATLGNTAHNVGTAIGALRQAGYTKQIALVNYYATVYDPANPETQAVAGLNQALAQVASTPALGGVKLVDVFSVFGAAVQSSGKQPCELGLLAKNADGSCDKHPSFLGQGAIGLALLKAIQ
ncbi:MAG: hypothetical protein JWN44_2889 [Myxococcales bacterium]|nr:hypothetical protein [Myxococcales bacterium]